MTLPNIPPSPGDDWRSWAVSLRDYLMKERAQSGKAAPSAPQIIHKKSGESAAQDGVMIYNPADEELEVSVDGGWKRIIRNEIEYLHFDQAADFAVGSGQMAWNAAEGTLDLGLNNGAVTLQLGQEIHYRVKNSTGSTIANGSVVSAAGTDGASGHILIQKFIADGTIPPRFLLGIATEDIPNGEFGYVTHFGKLSVNTSGFAAGDVLYPSATVAGALTATPPVSPDYEMPIAYALNSKNNGTIFVRIQTGYNIDELFDVQINSPANGDFLRYVSADGRWENRTANLDALSDVVITSAASGEVLRFNGTNWVDARLSLNDINTVSIGTAAAGEVLRYNGTNWVNAGLIDVVTFNDTTDFSETASDGQIGDATLPIKNASGGNNDFAQILFLLNSGNTLLARIAAVQTASTTSEMSFITEVSGTLAERFRIGASGTPTVSGGRFRIATSSAPSSSTATGTVGEIAWDSSYIYVCTATDTWKRVAIATW